MSFVTRMLNWYNWFNRKNQKSCRKLRPEHLNQRGHYLYMLPIIFEINKINSHLSQYSLLKYNYITIYFPNLLGHSENVKTNTNILHNYLKNQLRGVVSVSQIKWICDLRQYTTKQNITQNIYLGTERQHRKINITINVNYKTNISPCMKLRDKIKAFFENNML